MSQEFEDTFRDVVAEHARMMEAFLGEAPVVAAIAQAMVESLRGGGKICFMGNGGSAADSQHLATELVGRFEMERAGLASIAFTTDTSLLTAVGNDYGYEEIFRRQVEALVREGDVVVGLSTSGNSANVLAALVEARKRGAVTVGFTGGDGGRMRAESLADHLLIAPAEKAARIQEAHIVAGHVICGIVESELSAAS